MGTQKAHAATPTRTAYADLPVHPVLGMPYAWDVLDAPLGSLSRIDADARLRGMRSAVLGESFGLSLPLGYLDPPLFGRERVAIRISEGPRNTFEDTIDLFNPQSGSQWDGLLHVRAREFGFFGGLTDADEAAEALGMQHWAGVGIVGRGVLVDVARWMADRRRSWNPLGGEVLTAHDLRAWLTSSGVELQTGDIVCFRFGWTTAYRELDREARGAARLDSVFSGLCSDDEMAQFLWDAGVAAVCADNPAVEAAPGDPAAGSLHRRLIPLLGMCLGELFDFDHLAQRCADLGRSTFLFAAAPLGLPGGASSPANAVAVL